jgi:hypothetical protein
MAYQRVTSSDSFTTGATAATTVINAIETGLETAETTISSQTTSINALNNSAVYNVKNYGAVGDGTTDDYTAVMAAINAAHTAGGGIVMFPMGTYRINSQIVMPNLGTGTLYQQNPITLRGMTSQFSGYLDGNSNVRGTVLDLRYAGSDPKICTYAIGLLTFENLTLTDLGTSSNAFVYTTLTTLRTSNVTIQGNPSKSGATCDQDGFILGGTTAVYDNTINSGFSGYGTVIDQVRFDRIRRGVYGRTWCNSVVISNCTFGNSCGAANGRTVTGAATGSGAASTITMSSTSGTIKVGQLVSGTGIAAGQFAPTYVTALSGTAPTQTVTLSAANDAAVSGTITFVDAYAAIEFDGSVGFAHGNVLAHNLFEVVSYKYGVLFRNSVRNTGYGNSFWDMPSSVTGYAQGTAGTNTLSMLATTGTLAVGQTRTFGLNVAPMTTITALSGTAPTQTVTMSANHNATVGAITTATGTSGASTILTSTATTGTIAVGQLATGTGIGTNAIVTAVSGTAPNQTLTLSVVNSSAVSGTVTLGAPVQFDQFLGHQLEIGASSGYFVETYSGSTTTPKLTASANLINGSATGQWTFTGIGPNQNNSTPAILIRPDTVPTTSSVRLFGVYRSTLEASNANGNVMAIGYDGSISTAYGVTATGASGQTTYDYQSIVRSTGNLLMYAGADTNSVAMSRGVFKDRNFTTAARPSASTVGAGSCYYDTTLSKPVWSDGTNWKDAAGTTV